VRSSVAEAHNFASGILPILQTDEVGYSINKEVNTDGESTRFIDQ